VITSVDGADVRDAASLRRAVEEAPGAVSIELRGEGASSRALEIQPTRSAAMVGDRCGEVRAGALRPGRGTLVSYGVLVLGTLVMGVLGWRRGVPGGARVWPAFVTIPAIGAIAGTGAALVACDVGARELVLESALVGSEIVLVLLAGSAVWIASRAPRGPEPLLGGASGDEPPLSAAKTVGLGAFYVATWVPRVLVLATPLLLVAREAGLEGASAELGAVLGGDRTPLALAMTFVAGAVLAPIGEELLFRGLLLPHLARIVTPWAAIAISALLFGALHEAHGVARIGPMAIGAILGWARLRSGTLRAPIAVHVIVNASALSVGWLTGA
jgi:membrane protease YdiL (CAAX protease family)